MLSAYAWSSCRPLKVSQYRCSGARVCAVCAVFSPLKFRLIAQIGEEIKDQNALLDAMERQQGGIDELMTGTINKITGLMRGGAGSHMFVLFAFILVLFFVLFFIVARKG